MNPWTNVCLSVLSMCKISQINENVLRNQVIPSDLMCKPHSSKISETINCISSASDMFYEDGPSCNLTSCIYNTHVSEVVIILQHPNMRIHSLSESIYA